MDLVVEEEPVAYFEVQHNRHESEETREEPIEIFGNKQLCLGRNADLCDRWWEDLDISRVHLRIHCVVYDKDLDSIVPPSVYATDLSTLGTYLKKHGNPRASSQHDRGILMGNGGSFLLENGDELRLSNRLTLVYYEYAPAPEFKLTSTQELERRAFNTHYRITGRLLGSGAFGNVLVAVHQQTQRQLACKVVNLKNLYRGKQSSDEDLHLPLSRHRQHTSGVEPKKRFPTQVIRCCREVTILQDLTHPNIISIEKVFYSRDTLYIFEELVTGGDLFSYLENKGGRLGEVESAVIVRQILKGIRYLHGLDIVHRDLKPENILMTSLEAGGRIVITDFGNARILPESQSAGSGKKRMFSLVGTYGFAAPEIARRRSNQYVEGYSKAVDLWSLGCITAVLLSGTLLLATRYANDFSPDPIQRVSPLWDTRIIDDNQDPTWTCIGHRPKDFIKKLLVIPAEHRLTVEEALAHEWFSNERHAHEFEALYQRSIKDWKPRRETGQLIEEIREATLQTDLAKDQSLATTQLGDSTSQASKQSTQLKDEFIYLNSSENIASQSPGGQFPDQPLDMYEEEDSVQYMPPYLIHRSMSVPSTVQSCQEPQASGMYSPYENTGNGSMGMNNMSEVEDSMPVEFPPGYVRRHPSTTEPETSIVFETPIDDDDLDSPYVQVPQSSKIIKSQREKGRCHPYSSGTESSIVYETPVDYKGRYTYSAQTNIEQNSIPFYNAPVKIALKRCHEQHISLPSYADMFLNSQRA